MGIFFQIPQGCENNRTFRVTKGGTLGIQSRIFIPHYFEQGKIFVPFEENYPEST